MGSGVAGQSDVGECGSERECEEKKSAFAAGADDADSVIERHV